MQAVSEKEWLESKADPDQNEVLFVVEFPGFTPGKVGLLTAMVG